ncbi:hypothetical protein F356_011 [Campylobacter phage F356]|uniref:Uncharacterized protein n=15 Tax=Fletchervirus TaxID=1636618 RepID=A0A7T3KEX9_9CAUD|nr:hypothetical protein NCTC12673_gp089 [Campylobacter phage NCTC12673]YP_009321746.1 hypothetical protein BOX06_gp147 [Campylobacter phage PC14]QPX63147.1 hypothetical protein F348_011 [Campylobacter phage F348]QPX63315.1 hypothetical protein F352_011 [Campylobacter phage F352]QPX63482.1 hypothetical protein F355_011 [Campylobacter phage F355]QPX63649.1 hypothetical protein F356_011 [Campylobacter phage F356]QPX63818.1 hypothetical protein F357_011 [Campylobacter phage F357]QPX63982.1 hypot
MVEIMISFFAGGLIGFVAGYFVYHNNKEKASEIGDKIESVKDEIIKK